MVVYLPTFICYSISFRFYVIFINILQYSLVFIESKYKLTIQYNCIKLCRAIKILYLNYIPYSLSSNNIVQDCSNYSFTKYFHLFICYMYIILIDAYSVFMYECN